MAALEALAAAALGVGIGFVIIGGWCYLFEWWVDR